MQDRPETQTREERIPVDRADVDTSRDRSDAGTPRETSAAEDSQDRSTLDDSRDRSTLNDSRDRGISQNTASTSMSQPQSGAQQQVELLPRDVLDDFRTRWEKIQVTFVDEPRQAVQSAHDLVDQLVDRLAESFARQREGLEGTWSRGESDTEALRMALQQYRSFFNRLLST